MFAVRNWLFGGVVMALLTVAPYDVRGAGLPDSITLDSLEKLYTKSSFNHAGHITLIKDCGVCHHHTTGTLVDDANCVRCHKNSNETKVVACRGCHTADPFSAEAQREKESSLNLYHRDKPGLKGAYHLSCRGCHARMGGPTDCESCHKLKKEGYAFYRTGEFAPKKRAASGSHH